MGIGFSLNQEFFQLLSVIYSQFFIPTLVLDFIGFRRTMVFSMFLGVGGKLRENGVPGPDYDQFIHRLQPLQRFLAGFQGLDTAATGGNRDVYLGLLSGSFS